MKDLSIRANERYEADRLAEATDYEDEDEDEDDPMDEDERKDDEKTLQSAFVEEYLETTLSDTSPKHFPPPWTPQKDHEEESHANTPETEGGVLLIRENSSFPDEPCFNGVSYTYTPVTPNKAPCKDQNGCNVSEYGDHDDDNVSLERGPSPPDRPCFIDVSYDLFDESYEFCENPTESITEEGDEKCVNFFK